MNDGASALVVMSAARASRLNLTPMARIVGQATSGLAPKYLLMTPVDAVRRLSQKIGWPLDQIDLFELNEAFSVQAIAVLRDLGIDPQKVNVNGGAVALGHAIGSSGARILTTLLYALEQRKLKRGIATLCLGGGNGLALAVERLWRAGSATRHPASEQKLHQHAGIPSADSAESSRRGESVCQP